MDGYQRRRKGQLMEENSRSGREGVGRNYLSFATKVAEDGTKRSTSWEFEECILKIQ